jgi:hypothetical protein
MLKLLIGIVHLYVYFSQFSLSGILIVKNVSQEERRVM